MATIQSGFFVTKPSWILYSDGLQLLELSKQRSEEEKKIQQRVELLHIFARASFLAFIFSIEALANDILHSEFRAVADHEIPDDMAEKFGVNKKKGVSWCALSDKIALLPYLCKTPVDWNKTFFNKGSKDFQVFNELVQIRDSLAHARPVKRKIEIEISPSRTHKMVDNFPENFWPMTKIPRDLYNLNEEQAEIAKFSIDWMRSQLDSFLDGRLSKENWWGSEKIENLATVKRGEDAPKPKL